MKRRPMTKTYRIGKWAKWTAVHASAAGNPTNLERLAREKFIEALVNGTAEAVSGEILQAVLKDTRKNRRRT
jgi:hypothetical protein